MVGAAGVLLELLLELLLEVEARGSASSIAVAKTWGGSAVKTRSLSSQQLVLRPVTPASRVPCGVQQNSFFGLKQ